MPLHEKRMMRDIKYFLCITHLHIITGLLTLHFYIFSFVSSAHITNRVCHNISFCDILKSDLEPGVLLFCASLKIFCLVTVKLMRRHLYLTFINNTVHISMLLESDKQ